MNWPDLQQRALADELVDQSLTGGLVAGSGVDHETVRWRDVRWAAILIHQQFHYEYPGPVNDLRQRLVIIPPERHGRQRLITHRLEISSPTTEVRREVDAFGNLVIYLTVIEVPRAIDFTAWIVVEQDATAGPILVDGEGDTFAMMQEPSRLTEPDDALIAAARQLAPDVNDKLELARCINDWVHHSMTYVGGSTGVRTTAAQAFAQRSGVCQDYAHIMLAICRLRGVPARYVSGHLLGEGGTHAWVEVLLPDPEHRGRIVAHPFDPTNGNEPKLNYVTVAVGRDYGDVAPTSGSFRASWPGQLSSRKQAGLTGFEYFPECR